MKKILIIAGEASSDAHAASLVSNIRSLDPGVEFFGLGGDGMRAAGVNVLYNIVQHAFIGPGGLFKHYFSLRKVYYSLCAFIKNNKPDCAILIDYAEFNLRVARYLKKFNIPVIYYISPQVWAWGKWRIKNIKKYVDKVLVLFKFERDFYKQHGIEAVFVGHPLLDTAKTVKPKEEVLKESGIAPNSRVVGIVPGSRIAEIKNILPVMLKSARLIIKKLPDKKIDFVLPLAPSIDEDLVKNIVSERGVEIKIRKGPIYDSLNICDCAMVTSGTATLEAALMGVPMAILYKTNFLTYIVTKNVIKLPYIGIVNIIAGKNIVPEFLQNNAKAEKIAEFMVRILNEPSLAKKISEDLLSVKKTLGETGASRRAAERIVEFLMQR